MNLIDKYQENLPDWKQEVNKADYIYLIYAPETGLHKIGIARDLKRRFQQISSGSGLDCVLIDAIQMEEGFDESARAAEYALHKVFKQKRIRGEWFKLSIYDLCRLFYLKYFITGWSVVRNCDSLVEYRDEIKNGVCLQREANFNEVLSVEDI